ncbi:putative transmembrane protein [Liberibacter crescens BT-1]|uniref:Putative transmembrane protein n=1 Tax=Liberibacter crescens (strain BT-1) TaxID=1215343 RepID=L0EVU8_LIBCB|nr:TadE/TadG family type IV pilus assembly protein [Liberibacter crescens]AGA65067.1 putative transmembrane protein [Liberibacter crescens BT-1]AMC13059.1 hypothetical protein RL73_05465 [Liberibacter crescens]
MKIKSRKNLLHLFQCRSGVGAIEMTIIFPLLVIIYLGTYEITNLYSVVKRVTQISSSMADMCTRETNVSQLYFKGMQKLAKAIMLPYAFSNMDIKVYGYWTDDNKQTVQKWGWPNNAKDPGPLPSVADPKVFTVTTVISLQYKMLGFLSNQWSEINIVKTDSLRQREGKEIICSDCSS